MTPHHLLGAINSLFITLSLYGVFLQLRHIQRRKLASSAKPCAQLSLNQFTMSFLAYITFFIYGYSVAPFNHYLVWPRLIASLLVGLILYEIWQDRQSKSAKYFFIMALVIFIFSCLGLNFGDSYQDEGQWISTCLFIIVTLLLAQGYVHQILLIWRSGHTGAVAIRMSQFILLMDISTIAFAINIGANNSWPLLLLACTSAITKLIIMYLFRWVRISEQAKIRSAIAS
jgi:chromate transport protein ChrA